MSVIPKRDSISIPTNEPIIEGDNLVSNLWMSFFRSVYNRLAPIGIENSFPIPNNNLVATDIPGLRFDKRFTSAATVEFLCQRVTSSVELIEYGEFRASYNPDSEDWNIHFPDINSPENSGIDFTITSAGQIKYTSADIAGTTVISTLHYKVRKMAGKNSLYSSMGVV